MNLVIPEMSSYLCDESVLVKTACFQSLVEILSIFDHHEDAQHYLLRKLHAFIDYGLSTRDEHHLIAIARHIGKIASNLNPIMNTQAKSSLVNIFAQVCRDENLYARRSINEANFIWCKCKVNLAHSFADIICVATPGTYENKLAPCLTSLVRDRHEQVRDAIVTRIVDVAMSLGSSEYFRIITDFCTVLTDESQIVINSAVGQLEPFLNLFIHSGGGDASNPTNGIISESQQMPGCQLFTKRLLKLEELTSHTHKYALHCKILQAFHLLPFVLCTDTLIDEVLPVLEKRTLSRALPVRLAACQALLVILRKIPRFQVRNFYFTKLVEEFSLNTNCYKRCMFIEVSRLVLTLYSRNFFKQNFYKPLLRLAKDPVVNVRICFIKILADLKRLWKPTDRDKLENLEVVARGLLNDKDRDVSELAFRAITQMDYIRTHVNNDSEERENRVKDKEELVLMDLEPKKSAQTGKLVEGQKEVKSSAKKLTDSAKGRSLNTHYPLIKTVGSAKDGHSLTRSIDFSGRKVDGPLVDAYGIKDRKKETSRDVAMSADAAQISVRAKRTGEGRRNSLNGDNFSREFSLRITDIFIKNLLKTFI